MPDVKTLLQLGRVPNVFTAVSNVLAGYLLTHADLSDWLAITLLVGSSALLYTAGMVLNDVFDVAQDTEQRPQRPIPSGRISLAAARQIGFGLLFVGFLLGVVVGVLRETALPIVVACVLAFAIVAYDGPLKRSPLAPLAMGFCRFLNLLLGMSLLPFDLATTWHPMYWCVAAGVGVYVTGLTWFARTEAEAASSSVQLLAGMLVMLAGIGLLGYFPRLADADPNLAQPLLFLATDWRWAALWGLFGFFTVRRALPAVFDPSPEKVQLAVKQCIFAIVIFDAALVTAVHSPLPYAVVIVALLIPMQLLGSFVYST